MLQLFPSVALPRSLRLPRLPRAASSAARSAMAGCVEHVVLFDVKSSASSSQLDSMLSSLRALSSLPGVSHLACGPLLRLRSPLPFTHVLHARYPSKPDLAAYSSHPDHVAAVRSHVLPISDDILAVDWLSAAPPAPLPPGAAARITFARLGAGGEGKDEVLRVLGEVDAEVGGMGIRELSFGENFSPERAKGYSLAMMAVFGGVEGLEALDGAGKDAVEAKKEKVRRFLDSVIVLDFVVPAGTTPASL